MVKKYCYLDRKCPLRNIILEASFHFHGFMTPCGGTLARVIDLAWPHSAVPYSFSSWDKEKQMGRLGLGEGLSISDSALSRFPLFKSAQWQNSYIQVHPQLAVSSLGQAHVKAAGSFQVLPVFEYIHLLDLEMK